MRMLAMKIVNLSHVVYSLGVHEEGKETLFFTSKTMQAKKERIEQGLEDTHFTGWFGHFTSSSTHKVRPKPPRPNGEDLHV